MPPHPPFRKVWEAKATEQLQSFTVQGDRLYYGTLNAYGALDLKTGKRLWEKILPEKQFGAEVALADNTLFVAIGQRGLLACDPGTGTPRWSVPGTYFGIPPQLAGEGVLATLKEGFLSAISTRTHQPLWTADLRHPKPRRGGAEMEGPASFPPANPLTPAQRGDSREVFVGTYDAELFCLSAATGKPRWRCSFPRPDYRGEVSGLALSETRVFAAQDTFVHAVDRQSGKVLWRFPREDGFVHAPLLVGSLVLALSQMGLLCALDAATGTLRWSRRVSTELHPVLTPLCTQDGVVFVGTESQLLAFDTTGKPLWAHATPETFSETPLLLVEQGFIANHFHTLARFEPGESLTPPTPPPTPTPRPATVKLLADLNAQRPPMPPGLTDAQKVLRAAFDARFRRTDETAGLCVVELPPGVAPFALTGWKGKVVLREPKPAPKEATFVSFALPMRDFDSAAVIDHPKGAWALWNRDRTEVKLHLRTYVSSLNATGYDLRLKKVGTEWIVTEREMLWIS